MFRLLLTSWLFLSLINFASADSPARDDEVLSDEILPLVTKHRGDVAVAIQHLVSDEAFRYSADVPMPTASLIKLPLMVAVYHSVDRGEIDLSKLIALKDEDKVPGSGILTDHVTAGAKLSLRDYIRLMIRYSDNTATNIVIDQVGLATTATFLESLGMSNTKLHSKVYRGDTSIDVERSQQFGIGSTTANEMVALLRMLQQQKLGGATSTQQMLEHLAACDDRSKLARYLPSDTKMLHKTGAVGNCRTDAGIIETASGPVAVCVLTNKNTDQSWGDENEAELLCANIGRAIDARFGHNEPSNSLRQGATGLLVEALQRTLNARLDLAAQLSVDGDFGPATDKAVKRLQLEHGLEPSGILDPATWQKLGPLVDQAEMDEQPEQFNARVAMLPKQAAPMDSDPPIVTCKSWVVTEGVTGEQLSGFHANEPLPPASTTKIMTAHLVARMIAKDPPVADQIVTISQNADNTIGSSSTLRAGEQVTVLELLYGLMLPSGNDAAVAMAEYFDDRIQQASPLKFDKPTDAFIARMNERAKELGLSGTHFKNPNGLPDPEHVTTAADLARLAFVALQDDLFKRVVSTRQYACTVNSQQGYQRTVVWDNTNKLLDIDGYFGVKTGTTSAAGACLVALGSREGTSRIVVVLGSSDSEARYADSRNLFRWSLRNAPSR